MSAAVIIQFIRKQWEQISSSEHFTYGLKLEARRHKDNGGGAIWIKYNSLDENEKPQWTFVSTNDDLWNSLPQSIPNFDEIVRGYDPEVHYLLFLSAPSSTTMYGQMVRLRYDGKPEEIESNQSENRSETILNFTLS